MNFPWKLCLVFAALIFASRIQANEIDLILTEVNDNTLLASGSDGASWTIAGSGDSWTGTRNAPFDGLNNTYLTASWTDPNASAYISSLVMSYSNPDAFLRGAPSPVTPLEFQLNSDVLATSGDSPVTDGTVVTLEFGVYGEGVMDYNVQFIDDAIRTVPDQTSTALCFVLGLVSLVWFKRNHAVDQ